MRRPAKSLQGERLRAEPVGNFKSIYHVVGKRPEVNYSRARARTNVCGGCVAQLQEREVDKINIRLQARGCLLVYCEGPIALSH